jgi:hypothetical protein
MSTETGTASFCDGTTARGARMVSFGVVVLGMIVKSRETGDVERDK